MLDSMEENHTFEKLNDIFSIVSLKFFYTAGIKELVEVDFEDGSIGDIGRYNSNKEFVVYLHTQAEPYQENNALEKKLHSLDTNMVQERLFTGLHSNEGMLFLKEFSDHYVKVINEVLSGETK